MRPPHLRVAGEAPLDSDWPVIDQAPEAGLYLVREDGRLTLRDAGRPEARGVHADARSEAIRKRLESGRRSPLARAVGLHKQPDLRVLDATFGLGRDGFVLLHLGARIMGCERNSVLQQLLGDALTRAGALSDRWLGLQEQDAASWLQAHPKADFDVVYIDPMFDAPARKALPKLELQLLRDVVGDDADVDQLFAVARGVARQRVVVKQHPRGASLARPDFSVASGKTRFDVYLTSDRSFR
jgi:16S rRNA (guanine1516-N2)-methyltransferase